MTARLLRPKACLSEHAREAVQSKVSPGFTAMHAVSDNCVRHAGFIAKPDKCVDAHASQSACAEEGRLLPNDRPQYKAARTAAASGAGTNTFAIHKWTAHALDGAGPHC